MESYTQPSDEIKARPDRPQCSRWIAICSDMVGHPVVGISKPRHMAAWLWLLTNAAWKPKRRDIAGKTYTEQRGELVASLRFIADATHLSVKEVRTFLDRLVRENMISLSNTGTGTGITSITICNYEKYQTAQEGAGTAGAQQGHSRGTNLTRDTSTTLRDNNNPSNLDAARDELACLNGARVEIIEQMAAWISPYAPDRQSAERWLGTVVGLHGGEVVKQAFGEIRAKITQGDLIARPIPLFDKICQRIKSDAARKAAPTTAPKPAVTAAQYQAHIERLIGHA
jgi:hypothetical protein